MFFVNEVSAQSISAGNSLSTSLSPAIGSLSDFFNWVINLLQYLGWAGVILGVALAIVMLIYKLFAGDNEESMKTVQGYITRAVLIIVAGILLLGMGWLITVVGNLFGLDLSLGFSTN